MKHITGWNDLTPFGIEVLTGEACGLSYRLLCDVTDEGKAIIKKCLSLQDIVFPEPWNRGPADRPHSGSIMLCPEMYLPLGIFALLESGCREAWQVGATALIGLEESDSPEEIELMQAFYKSDLKRTYAYRGDAGDRFIHQMTGRVM